MRLRKGKIDKRKILVKTLKGTPQEIALLQLYCEKIETLRYRGKWEIPVKVKISSFSKEWGVSTVDLEFEINGIKIGIARGINAKLLLEELQKAETKKRLRVGNPMEFTFSNVLTHFLDFFLTAKSLLKEKIERLFDIEIK